MATAIEFNHVGKQYRLGLVSTRTLSHDLNRWWQTAVRHKEDPYLKIGETYDRSKAGESEYVWALRDIDFKVEQSVLLWESLERMVRGRVFCFSIFQK